jgi:hypothetical protein
MDLNINSIFDRGKSILPGIPNGRPQVINATFCLKNRYLYTMLPYNDVADLSTILVMVEFPTGSRTTL